MGNSISFYANEDKICISILDNEETSWIKAIIKAENLPHIPMFIGSICFYLLDFRHSVFEKLLEKIKASDTLEIPIFAAAEKIRIPVTGYNFEEFSKTLQRFLGEKTEISIEKTKEVKATVAFIEFSLLQESKNILHSFKNPVPLMNLHDIGKGILPEKNYFRSDELKYPFLLVNIKSGLSFYKIIDKYSFKRVGGSIVGESAVINLLRFLTNKDDLDTEVMKAIQQGDNRNVDMTVGDIYGESIDSILSKSIIASSFGKVGRDNKDFKKEDIVRALFTMFAINSSQLAFLFSEIEKLDQLVVVSSHLVHDEFFYSFQSVMNFWSKGKEKKLFFLEFVQYAPCLGNLIIKNKLLAEEINGKDPSVDKN